VRHARGGVRVWRNRRGAGQRLPVIVLTARGDPYDRIEGLETGADDYLPKPFHFEELVARIRARLRDERPVDEQTQLRVGGVGLDLRTRWASVNGEKVEL